MRPRPLITCATSWLSLCTNGKSSANSTNHDMQDWEHLPLPVRPHLLVFLGSNHDESLQSRIDMLKVRTRMLRNSLVRGVIARVISGRIAISRRTQTSSRKAHGSAVRQSVQCPLTFVPRGRQTESRDRCS